MFRPCEVSYSFKYSFSSKEDKQDSRRKIELENIGLETTRTQSNDEKPVAKRNRIHTLKTGQELQFTNLSDLDLEKLHKAASNEIVLKYKHKRANLLEFYCKTDKSGSA